jgi:hypothetical protein
VFLRSVMISNVYIYVAVVGAVVVVADYSFYKLICVYALLLMSPSSVALQALAPEQPSSIGRQARIPLGRIVSVVVLYCHASI